MLPSARGSGDLPAGQQMIAYVRGLIEKGALHPGDRLAPERELVRRIGVSRASVRAGLHALAAMGFVTARRGAGTFITPGPPVLTSEPLGLLTALHDVSPSVLFEAGRVLEADAAALAAGRATGDQLAALADEITGMYAALGDRPTFLRHAVRFHEAVAAAANNLVLGALIGMITALPLKQRCASTEGVRDPLRGAADMYRRVYNAIRSRDVEGARAAMDERLRLVQAVQLPEKVG